MYYTKEKGRSTVKLIAECSSIKKQLFIYKGNNNQTTMIRTNILNRISALFLRYQTISTYGNTWNIKYYLRHTVFL